MFAADPKVSSVSPTESSNSEVASSWKQIVEPVEPFLDAVNHRLSLEVDSFDASIRPYADYALKGEGKHLRPALVALTASALGKVTDAHATIAVVVEMVHLATLVHDDIMDEGEIRRGRLTLAANYGNEIAVLFGDCLFAQALRLAAGFPTPDVCRAVATATKTVCSGEILQTQHRRDFEFTQARYFEVLEMKTAELFALSCELSAHLHGTSHDRRTALRQFGLAFGVAYQLYDDCVDLFGSEEVAGKSLGTDLAKGKLTLPILLARDRANEEDRRVLRELILNWEPAFMDRLGQLLQKYFVLASSIEAVRQHLHRARQAIQALPDSKGRAGLIGLTAYLGRQAESLATCL